MQYLYETIFYSEKVNQVFSNASTIGLMLRFESALAAAQARHGIIPEKSATIIKRNCKLEKINPEQLIEEAGLSGNLNIPLVKQLTSIIKKENEEAAKYVHFGATSQDVIDTALMMQLRDATKMIAGDLNQLIRQLIFLTKEHRNTIMAGRSFMQQARPISFGFKAAGWLDPLLRSKQAMQVLLKEVFVLQLGGAVGTLSSMGKKGLQVSETMGAALKLNVPAKSWHAQRDRLALIASVMGILTENIGKIGKDISLMAQTEIGELKEPYKKGKGGSSAMPHKQNPVGCISILSNAARVPALVSIIFSSMVQDHERATGLWHAEWQTMADIMQLTAGTVVKAVEITDGLRVNRKQMLINLEITKGLIYAENISMALAPLIGKAEAHELVEQLSRESQSKNKHLKEICIHDPIISNHLKKSQIEKCFDPALSTGICNAFIDMVLKSS